MSQSDQSGRVRLAEAMGRLKKGMGGGYRITADDGTRVTCWTLDDALKYLPDPFTDANDDYAVLEWMRDGDPRQYSDFKDRLFHFDPPIKPWMWLYQVGDYAKAALKVLPTGRGVKNE